jgi:hypothetical protein
MINYTILMHLKKKTEIFSQNSNYGQSTKAGGWSGVRKIEREDGPLQGGGGHKTKTTD